MWPLLLIGAVLTTPSPEKLAARSEQLAGQHDGFACLIRIYPAGKPAQAKFHRLYKYNDCYRIDELSKVRKRNAFDLNDALFTLDNPDVTGGTIISPEGIVEYDHRADSVGLARFPAGSKNVLRPLELKYLGPVNSLFQAGDYSVADFCRMAETRITSCDEVVGISAMLRPARGPDHRITVWIDATTGLATRWGDDIDSPIHSERFIVETETHPEIGPVVRRFVRKVDTQMSEELNRETIYEFTDYRPWKDPAIFDDVHSSSKRTTIRPAPMQPLSNSR